jgi:hypothetical protein
MIKFDLPENFNEEDFIIELKDDGKQIFALSMRATDLKAKR